MLLRDYPQQANKCPVLVHGCPCGLQLFRMGVLDDSLWPSFDVYRCAKGHETYQCSKQSGADL